MQDCRMDLSGPLQHRSVLPQSNYHGNGKTKRRPGCRIDRRARDLETAFIITTKRQSYDLLYTTIYF